jgi:hypothetical protein
MLYFILDTASDALKIGFADDPGARFGQLQCGNPHPLRLVGSIPGGPMEEAAFHRRFHAHRIAGEWFRYEPIAAEVRALIMGQDAIPAETAPTVAQVVERIGTRHCLQGMMLRHVPTGVEFGCERSNWNRLGRLMVISRDGPDTLAFPAAECVFLVSGPQLERLLHDNLPTTRRKGRRRPL